MVQNGPSALTTGSYRTTHDWYPSSISCAFRNTDPLWGLSYLGPLPINTARGSPDQRTKRHKTQKTQGTKAQGPRVTLPTISLQPTPSTTCISVVLTLYTSHPYSHQPIYSILPLAVPVCRSPSTAGHSASLLWSIDHRAQSQGGSLLFSRLPFEDCISSSIKVPRWTSSLFTNAGYRLFGLAHFVSLPIPFI